MSEKGDVTLICKIKKVTENLNQKQSVFLQMQEPAHTQ